MSFKEEYITRHYDLISKEAMRRKIIIVGAGAIGSFVTLSLAKMGYQNLHVIDFDTVEPENIGSQFYSIDSIGKPKVLALREMVAAFTGIQIDVSTEELKVNSCRLSADIVIAAVDSMAVRELIYNLSDCYWLIDPRMGAEYATMNTVDMANRDSRKDYRASIFPDSDGVQERCTAKTTIYTVLLIAGQVAKAVKDITTWKVDESGDTKYTLPISSLEWNIRSNAMVAFSNGRKL